MKKFIRFDRKTTHAVVAIAVVILVVVLLKSGPDQPANIGFPATQGSGPGAPASGEPTVDLAPNQLKAVKFGAVGTHAFSVEKTALGSIDYDEDMTVQVSSSYPGKILAALVNLGDDVKNGQPLYTIDSPDLIQVESALIAAAADFESTSKELARAKALFGTNGVSERELEQTTSAEQTAEGRLKASRATVQIFGKTDAEIDQILTTRKIDPALVVSSPITGRIIARHAQPGLLVQPGNLPAPYAVADLGKKWMVVHVAESDIPMFHVGQPVRAALTAYPGRFFEGGISRMGEAVDPDTHRLMVRCEIADSKNELRPGMLAEFLIRVQDPAESVAMPMSGVVRNSDGTMAVWVTTDRHRFVQRIVKVGLQQDSQYQILEGLQTGETAVTDGALFLSNIPYAPPAD
jgi:cobalt-zinc-cadmium efflux system membrane fusion protein